MNSKIIDGKTCISRDVVYSSFGNGELEATEQEVKDVTYSWDQNETKLVSPYDYESDSQEDKEFSELKDSEYSGGLSTRLIMLKRPLYIQLLDLYQDHSRLYKAKGSRLNQEDINILLDDFRYELHRIIAKAKDQVIQDGGNVDNILRLTSFRGGGIELIKAAKSLTVLFKRIETAYTTFGYIPRDYQQKMNDALSVLISHFIMDVYGPELERRKTATSVFANKSDKLRE